MRRRGIRSAGPGLSGLAVAAWIGVLLLLGAPSLTGAPVAPRSDAPGAADPTSGAPVGNWSTFHGSVNRSGEAAGAGPSGPTTVWFRHLSVGQIRAGPVGNASQTFVADTFGMVYDLNTSNGSVRWRASVGLNPTTPALAADRLVVASGNGGVTSLNATTGLENWSVVLTSRVTGPVGVVGGIVVVGTDDGTVAGLSMADGHRLWGVSLGAGVAGAVAYESGRWYATTDVGGLFAFDSTGRVLWTANVSEPVDTGPAVAFGRVVVVDLRAVVTVFNATDGSLDWRYNGGLAHAGDGIESTPAVGASGVYVSTDLGAVVSLSLSDGALRWGRNVSYTGYAERSAPVLTVTGLYVWDASESLDAFVPSDGRLLWTTGLSGEPSYSSPDVEGNNLSMGNEGGYVWEFGGGSGGTPWNVTGHVLGRGGTPVAGATIAYSETPIPVAANGSFLLQLINGSYALTATAPGYAPTVVALTVTGPVSGLEIRIAPLVLYAIEGTVQDRLSGHPLPHVLVEVQVGYWTNRTHSAIDGSFVLYAPNGTTYVTAQPPDGYDPIALHVVVVGAPVTGVSLGLSPNDLAVPSGTVRPDILLPVAALAGAGVGVAFLAESRRRTSLGLPPTVLSPFSRFVAMRSIMVFAQTIVVLALLFTFGSYLPLLARPGSGPCQLAPQACTGCTWADIGCSAWAYVVGLFTLVWNLFTGDWGFTSFGNLQEPAALFIQWWLPYSVELAVVALLLSAAIAYPLGLLSGWRRDSVVDVSARGLSTVGLLIPTFLVLLFTLALAYQPFSNAFGDVPYDVIPSTSWFAFHGEPAWFGPGFNTSPTGFPLVDGAIHGDWPFVEVVAVKTVLQALIIAVIYVGIFLRYARHAVVEAIQEPHVHAARARGVPEGALLWRHTARRVWPIYLLVFGLTFPAYIGTQAVVEALAGDHGVGTLLIAQMTHVQSTAFGVSAVAAGPHVGNLYQVLVFIVVVVGLIGRLLVDIVARYLDPRLVRRGEL